MADSPAGIWPDRQPEPERLPDDYRQLLRRRLRRLNQITRHDEPGAPARTIAERMRLVVAELEPLERRAYPGMTPKRLAVDPSISDRYMYSQGPDSNLGNRRDLRRLRSLEAAYRNLAREEPDLDPAAEASRIKLEFLNDHLARGGNLETFVNGKAPLRYR